MRSHERVFESDGWDARLRVGLLVPDGDVGPESEWSAMTPPGVAVNASRFRFPVSSVVAATDRIDISPVEFVAAPGPLDDAIGLLNGPSIEIYSLAFTSTSYVADDANLVDRLSAAADGRPVVTTGQALLATVEHLGAERVMLVDPAMVSTRPHRARPGLARTERGAAGTGHRRWPAIRTGQHPPRSSPPMARAQCR